MPKKIIKTTLIYLGEWEVHLFRKRIRNIYLRIDREGNIQVSAPLKCSLEYIQDFLQKKRDWIHKHRRSAIQLLQQSNLKDIPYLFLGKPFSLIIHEQAEYNRIILSDNQIACHIKSPEIPDIKNILLTNWQKQQFEQLLPTFIEKWEAIINVRANQWRIRAMKTRWGSCNPTNKRICLNLNLMHYPPVCIEYVVVHELVHLLEASHNQRFYQFMNQFMPEWKTYKNMLKTSLQGQY